MNKAITSEILISYSQCPRKAYILCTDQRGIPNEYISIIQQRKEALQRNYINAFKQNNPDVQPHSLDNLKSGNNYLTDVNLAIEGFKAECGFLTKINESSPLGNYSYERIHQTCRLQGKSFLKFLFSGEKDIDQFMVSKHLGGSKLLWINNVILE
jgi:hypothetical protein